MAEDRLFKKKIARLHIVSPMEATSKGTANRRGNNHLRHSFNAFFTHRRQSVNERARNHLSAFVNRELRERNKESNKGMNRKWSSE